MPALFVSLTSAERRDLNDVMYFDFLLFFLGTWRWLLASFFALSSGHLSRLPVQKLLRVSAFSAHAELLPLGSSLSCCSQDDGSDEGPFHPQNS